MNRLTVYDQLEQGSPEWIAARRGILTASVIGRLVTPTLKTANNDMSRALTMTLAAERITGRVEEMHVTDAMWRGMVEEPLARDMYAEHHAPVNELGFMVRDFGSCQIGYSPDGLVGDNGLIEIKSRGQKTQIATVMSGQVPAANMAQLQCGLLVSGREWIDYISYSSGMALWTRRVYPDQEWQEALLAAAEQFETAAAGIVDSYRTLTAGLPVAAITQDPTEITFGG